MRKRMGTAVQYSDRLQSWRKRRKRRSQKRRIWKRKRNDYML
jgi:hypothetical protein